MSASRSIIDSIAQQFEAGFREHLGPIRKVGREAEFPLVWPDGRAGDATLLWAPLLSEGGFTVTYDDPQAGSLIVSLEAGNTVYALEVGRGTIEISIGPYDDLWGLKAGFEDALRRLVRAAAARGLRLLAFGIQPRTPPTPSVMTPRVHYRALYGVLGAPWLRLTTTAADQTHVDICRAELLDAINWMNLLSGPMIALCANSSVYAGRVGGFVSGRERLLRDLGEQRYGMTPHRFGSVREYVSYLCDYPCYVLPSADGYRRVNRRFVRAMSRAPGKAYDEFLWHEHYVWNSARARVKNSTIEMRPACQQPLSESLAANALSLGWVEMLPQLADFLTERLGPDPWPAMGRYRRAAVRQGLAASEPAPGLLAGLIDLAAAGLERRGREEAALLQPIRERLERQTSPAMTAREAMRQGGMSALLARITIPPP